MYTLSSKHLECGLFLLDHVSDLLRLHDHDLVSNEGGEASGVKPITLFFGNGDPNDSGVRVSAGSVGHPAAGWILQ